MCPVGVFVGRGWRGGGGNYGEANAVNELCAEGNTWP